MQSTHPYTPSPHRSPVLSRRGEADATLRGAASQGRFGGLRNRFLHWAAAALLGALLPISLEAEPHSKLTFLPNSPTGVDKSWATGVDDSGTKIVGSIALAGNKKEAAYWTVGDPAPVLLGFLFGGDTSWATAISRSGKVIVGAGGSQEVPPGGHDLTYGIQGFRWTASRSLQGLSLPTHGHGENTGETQAFDVSGDGKTIVGERGDPFPVPVRWSNLQPTFLGTGTGFGFASAVSADGFHIVGMLPDSAGIPHPTIWDGLVPQPLPDELGAPTDVSGDGTIVLGAHAIWTENSGVKMLEGEFTASQLDDDATLVAGHQAVRTAEWRPGRGVQDLATVLIHDYGIGSQLGDWTLAEATAVNGAGNTIVGTALFHAQQVGFVVQLADPLPGDANFDDRVDLLDFGILSDHFGSGHWRDQGDVNRDFAVDLSDFGILKANFGTRAGAVPEPAGLVLAGIALIWMGAWIARGRRHSSILSEPE